MVFKQKSDTTRHNHETQRQGTSSTQLSTVILSRITALPDSVDGGDETDHYGNINTTARISEKDYIIDFKVFDSGFSNFSDHISLMLTTPLL